MAWVRVDTAFARHPKLLALTERQRWVHLAALCWAGEQFTGGVIPAGALPMIGGRRPDADRLVEIGLWDRDPGGYRIHDWDVYNADATRGKEVRDADASRRRRWREEKRAQREAERAAAGKAPDMSTPRPADTTGHVPARARSRDRVALSRPVPSPVPPTGETGRVKGATPAPAPGAQAPRLVDGATPRVLTAVEALGAGLVEGNVARVLARRGIGPRAPPREATD